MHTYEPSILALYAILIMLTIIAQVVFAMGQHGIGYLLSARDTDEPSTGIAGRLERATTNSVVAMALFAPAVLILGLHDAYSNGSIILCQVFLAARVLYVLTYALGIPVLRTLFWLVGFGATLGLFLL